VHAGSVDAWSADLAPVARALVRLHEAGKPARLTLLGAIEYRGPELDRADRLGLVHVAGKVSREEAQRAAAASDVALLVQKRPSKIWVTTKLWDYLASQTPILVAANPECDAAAIVRETKAGWTVPYDDEDGIVRVLSDVDERRRRGETLWQPDADALRRYDATTISRRFVELLNELRP
jgi:glycosyltransferase involved in cell wall biosynthesis